jgi:hypothetical protein
VSRFWLSNPARSLPIVHYISPPISCQNCQSLSTFGRTNPRARYILPCSFYRPKNLFGWNIDTASTPASQKWGKHLLQPNGEHNGPMNPVMYPILPTRSCKYGAAANFIIAKKGKVNSSVGKKTCQRIYANVIAFRDFKFVGVVIKIRLVRSFDFVRLRTRRNCILLWIYCYLRRPSPTSAPLEEDNYQRKRTRRPNSYEYQYLRPTQYRRMRKDFDIKFVFVSCPLWREKNGKKSHRLK